MDQRFRLKIKDQGLYPHRLGLITARFGKNGGWEEEAEQEDNSTHLSNRLLIQSFIWIWYILLRRSFFWVWYGRWSWRNWQLDWICQEKVDDWTVFHLGASEEPSGATEEPSGATGQEQEGKGGQEQKGGAGWLVKGTPLSFCLLFTFLSCCTIPQTWYLSQQTSTQF